jgi:hypothetical protein
VATIIQLQFLPFWQKSPRHERWPAWFVVSVQGNSQQQLLPVAESWPIWSSAIKPAALSLLESPEYRQPFYRAGFNVIGDGK